MNEFELGRDFQDLKSRVEYLESAFCDYSFDPKRHDGISAMHYVSAGVQQNEEPVFWKPKKAMKLPVFMEGLLRVPKRLTQFDIMPESKTWSCHPEPLILSINWNSGGSDEFYRLQDQVFSIIRITEPNSGHISCTAIYSSRLVASGKAKSHYFPPTGNPNYQMDPGYFPLSYFKITLRSAQGGTLGSYTSPGYTISCQDNHDFTHIWDINAGIFDLIAGATWEVLGVQTVDRC